LDAAKSGDQSARLAIVGGARVSRDAKVLYQTSALEAFCECLLYGLLVILPPL
jgi:hypothetical protein